MLQTAAGARALIEAGADAIKVAIGPGSICTPRGRRRRRAAADRAHGCGGGSRRATFPVIADGGIKYIPGDLGQGRSPRCRLLHGGSLLARATDESPGRGLPLSGCAATNPIAAWDRWAPWPGAQPIRYFQQEGARGSQAGAQGVEGRLSGTPPQTSSRRAGRLECTSQSCVHQGRRRAVTAAVTRSTMALLARPADESKIWPR